MTILVFQRTSQEQSEVGEVISPEKQILYYFGFNHTEANRYQPVFKKLGGFRQVLPTTWAFLKLS
ncbi:MAG: hypothetical protein C0507_24480 [Cyanobacteria bacterium PR.3.49]|nr:hypothetical protein [Cyanobacteria bacterium PR.3.49]